MTKPRFTLEEHKETGQKLKGIYDELNALKLSIGNAFPQSSRAGKTMGLLDQMQQRVLKVRSEMEEQMAADLPETLKADGWQNIYYGSRK